MNKTENIIRIRFVAASLPPSHATMKREGEMMDNPLNRIREYIARGLWTIQQSSLNRIQRFSLEAAGFVVVIFRDVRYGQVTLWAMGLVYTTLMSLVPLLAVSFSVLKAFGVQGVLEPFLLDVFAPLGPNGAVMAHWIVRFVSNMKVGVLGTVGLTLLLYTVMSLIRKVEQAFNAIWRVRGSRSMLNQFSQYLSVVLAGPVLVVSALALTASFMSTAVVQRLMGIEPLGTIIEAVVRLIPYLLVIASFTFLYLFIPNTRVRFIPALVGGVTGGVLWQSVGWAFTSFIVASTRYAAIYSGFAILVLFMTWVYLSWLILLIGSEVSFYYQNPHLVSI
jgi:membrane protein